MKYALLMALALALQPVPKQAERLRWVPNPREADGSWVADPARRLRPATVDSLDALIGALERETSSEIAVVVLDSLSGLEPADAALALHRLWGVGKEERDNGIVFLWSPNERAVFVSVGYGLEGVLPDGRVGRIRDQHIFPAFRENRFDEGVLAGVAALAEAAREETEFRPGGAAAARERRRGRAKTVGLFALGLLGLGGAGAGGALARRRWLRNRPRLCPNGHGPMRRAAEQADDAYLEQGEAVEERVKSVDYDVWVCAQCGATTKVPYRKTFSSYDDCPQCRRRTVKTTSKTLRSATTSRTGLRRVTKTCAHCRWEKVQEEVIPMETASSSSSGGGGGGGGGGSSFGGGSAGGGGAGGRY